VKKPRNRSRLSQAEARRRYVEMGEAVLLDQVRAEAEAFDAAEGDTPFPLGQFARLDASQVAAIEGKTRGAITNLFGSQIAYQAASMTGAAVSGQDDMGGIDEAAYPACSDFPQADAWIRVVACIEAARGPQNGRRPTGYAGRWVLWLTLVPYAMWSRKAIAASSAEFHIWVRRIEAEIVQPALEHFQLELRAPYSSIELATAMANLVEGLWLTQCIEADRNAAPNALAMLWKGATQPRG
jgi:hypothetical protein